MKALFEILVTVIAGVFAKKWPFGRPPGITRPEPRRQILKKLEIRKKYEG